MACAGSARAAERGRRASHGARARRVERASRPAQSRQIMARSGRSLAVLISADSGVRRVPTCRATHRLRRRVTIEPAMPASIAFEGSHQIVLEPKIDLQPRIYRVQVHPRAPAPWLTQPTLTMRRVQVCRDDGFLANDLCEAVPEWVPSASHFERQSPYHQRVHLDRSSRYRVDSTCERVASMQHLAWFVLPLSQEFYYRRNHADYRDLPPYRSDCERSHGAPGDDRRRRRHRLSRAFEVLGTHP